jgi:hypothetical protein
MRARIHDAEALRAISPAAVAAFARSEGWEKIAAYGAHADVYSATGRPEIIIPRTDLLADYPSVISRLISIFSQVSERDELQTYRDLVCSDRDVIRVRAVGADDDGSVSLDAGVKIVENARDMLLAAACAARSRQVIYRPGANREAVDYMRRVKLGQTEHGSFIVTLLAPVPPLLPAAQLPLDADWVGLEREPMERQVTIGLTEALDASRQAAELALSGDGDAFDEAVSAGVSVNLCEAVAGLIEESGSELDISISWARTRPMLEPRRKVIFSQNDASILREAARTFRQRQPRPDVSLYGWVNKLRREQDEADGVVTFKVAVDEKIQSVRATLDQGSYEMAVEAHGAKKPVLVTGDLRRVGERWQLDNPSIRFLPDEEDSGDKQDAGGA